MMQGVRVGVSLVLGIIVCLGRRWMDLLLALRVIGIRIMLFILGGRLSVKLYIKKIKKMIHSKSKLTAIQIQIHLDNHTYKKMIYSTDQIHIQHYQILIHNQNINYRIAFPEISLNQILKPF